MIIKSFIHNVFLCHFTNLFPISFCHFLLNYLIRFPMENLQSWREQVSQALNVHRTFKIKTNIAAYNI